MKKIIQFLAGKPIIFDTVRCILEINHISLKKVIKKEFILEKNNPDYIAREKVLDVPCGTGVFCMLFNPESYHGFDISETFIDYARKKYDRKFICGDAMHSGFDNGYFDKILTIGFLHHLDDSSVSSVLKEVKRILKPDGTLLLIEDAPITNKYNIIGKFILNNDVGSNIRSSSEYRAIFEKYFIIRNSYIVKSGFFNYSAFVLSSNLKT